MKILKYFIITTFCLAAISDISYAEKRLRAGFIDFPPYVTVSNTVGGLVVDRITKAFRKAKIPYTLLNYPPKRMFAYLKNGKVDFIITTEGRNNEFSPYGLISKKPFMKIFVKIYSKNRKIPSGNLTGTIGIIHGYHYDHLKIDPAASVHSVHYHDSLFLMLNSNRLDYVIDYSVPSEGAVKKHGIRGIKSKLIKEINLYFCIRKEFPQSKLILKKIVQNYRN